MEGGYGNWACPQIANRPREVNYSSAQLGPTLDGGIYDGKSIVDVPRKFFGEVVKRCKWKSRVILEGSFRNY